MDLGKLDQYDGKTSFLADLRKRTFDTEVKSHGCAQVIVQTFLDVFEEDNTLVSMASSPFAAGLSLTGNNCGALIGGLMVLGLFHGRKDLSEGMPGILAGIRPMRKLVRYFEDTYRSPNCRDITGTDLANPQKAASYFEAGGLEKCATMMADVAAFVGDIIYEEAKKGTKESQ
ncbi:MAG: C-GCAxxG-C-C family protein [Deltaproteobacteria bacterium]|nr:C-GCAxxG-C-C family protein [Deltaproteobacteria bacterium]